MESLRFRKSIISVILLSALDSCSFPPLKILKPYYLPLAFYQLKPGTVQPIFVLVFAVFSLVLLPTVVFWMSFGSAIFAGQSTQIKADLLYKGSAMLLLLGMLPVVIRFF